jgi:hypothetical protein
MLKAVPAVAVAGAPMLKSLFQKPGSHLENPWKTRPFSGLWNRL